MKSAINSEELIGKRFGRLTVLSSFLQAGMQSTRRYTICECDCGKKVKVRHDALTSGRTTSCGCYHSEICKKNSNLFKSNKK